MKELRQKDENLSRLLKTNSLIAITLYSAILSLLLASCSLLPSLLSHQTALAFKPSAPPSEPTTPQTPSSNTASSSSTQGSGEGSTSGPAIGCGPDTDNSTCNQSSNPSQTSITPSDQSGSGVANSNTGGFSTSGGGMPSNNGFTNSPLTGGNQQFSPNTGTNNQTQQGINGIASQSSNYLQYQSPTFGFVIQYPAISQVTERPNGAIFNFGGNEIFVLVQNVNNMGLSGFTQSNINTIIQTFPTARNGQFGDDSLAGYPGHYLDFATPTGVQGAVSWTVVGNAGYTLGFFFTHPTNSVDIAGDQRIIHDVFSSFQISTSQFGPQWH